MIGISADQWAARVAQRLNRSGTMLHCQRANALTAAAFGQDTRLATRLAACNTRWQERLALFRAQAGSPWWAPGLILTPELRSRYEAYLPLADFSADLTRLGELLLPHPSWVPRLLGRRRGGVCPLPDPDGPASVPDLWARLPATFAGRFDLTVDELPALFCALADPPHFGTNAERYPVQQQWLETRLTAPSLPRIDLLDLACGVGLGTYATAALAQGCGVGSVRAVGLTLEPLEAWMAARRCLPHDPQRQQRLQRLAAGAPHVHFAAADVRRLPVRGPFDVILCNGLAGGTLLQRDPDLQRFLSECARVVVPAGWLLLSNRFHDGRRTRVERVAHIAGERGWRVSGDWHDLALQWLGPQASTPSGGGSGERHCRV